MPPLYVTRSELRISGLCFSVIAIYYPRAGEHNWFKFRCMAFRMPLHSGRVLQQARPPFRAFSEAGESTFHRFDAAAKAMAFRNVFDGGLPMWMKLGELVQKELPAAPSKILSVGDGPGEPGCYLAAKFGAPTLCTDSVVPMVEAAKQRVKAKGLKNVECLVLDMQDLSTIESSSIDLVASAHAYPFSPDKPRAFAEAFRVLRPGGVFGAVVWVSFELLPFAGAIMSEVTGTTPAPPPPGSPPPPPLSLGEPSVSDPLLAGAGFELCAGTVAPVSFTMTDLDVALKYCALPIWDRLTSMEESGELPGAWATYAAAWPEVARAKGHLTDEGQFSMSGVYRAIIAKKPM